MRASACSNNSMRTCLNCWPLTSFGLFATLLSAQTAAQPPLWSAKPDVTAFESIENAHLAAAQKAIDALTAVNGSRTIENTVTPFDDATRELNSAQYFSSLMEQVHPDQSFRDRASAMTRKISDAARALSLNQAVFKALAALKLDAADPATRYYVQRQLLEFRLAGVNRDDATRAKLRQLNDQLTEEQSAFDRNISDGQKAVEVDSPSELDGLPQDYIGRHKPGADGKISISTNYPDALPALKFAKNDAFRQRLFVAFDTRAYPKNLDVLKRMMRTRYQIATTLGYTSWADYNAADKMIGRGAKIGEFIQQIQNAAQPLIEREFAMLLNEKGKVRPGANLIADYEQSYFSEQVRRSQFDFDSQSARPYLAYARVKQGVLDTASKLFQVTFRQEQGVPAWDPAVETWDVLDGGKMIGRIYLDMHPRPGKYSHAEMAPVRDGVRGKQLPEAILVCNFPHPAAGDPALMEYDDVVTFFHEFGHLMHWVLGGQQPWAGISGISMESDFAEAPSQMLEEWMHSPQVLATFARHYQTNEPIPVGMVARMNRASAYGRAMWSGVQNSYTAISYNVYKGKPDTIDPDKVDEEAQRRYTPFTHTPGTHIFASFGHLGGYSSAYYTYLWDKVIAEDFFQQFDRSNLLAGPAPMRYRRAVLEPGGSVSANDLVKNFLGRSQDIRAFQLWMGEEFQR
jgi:thimet oligopeptidase